MKQRPVPRAPFALDYLMNEFIQPLNVQWIDGRPVVRQTFDLAGQTGGESATIKAAGAWETLIEIGGFVTNNAGELVPFPFNTTADVDYAVIFTTGGIIEFEASATQVAPGGLLVLLFTEPAGFSGGGG